MNAEEKILVEKLKGVIDPELMVNIVDLGLVYDVRFNDEKNTIDIDITLTSPSCPMGELIIEDAKQLVEVNYPNHKVEINLVWEPVWTIEKITVQGKIALGN